MKKVFSLIMMLSIFLSSSSLVSAVNSSDPPKQSPIKTHLPRPRANGVESEIFDQSEYGEQNIVLTIGISPNMGIYGYERIKKLNYKSVDDAKEFYSKFFGDTSLDIRQYNRGGSIVKNKVKEQLNEKKAQTHASEDLNEVLRQFMESRIGGIIFYHEFTSETTINNIFPGCYDLEEEERVAMYRRDGQILQFKFMHVMNSKIMGVNNPHHYFIFDSGIRVFPNTHAVRDSVIGKYIKGVYKKRIDEDDRFIPRGATMIIKIPSPVPSECVKNYITAVWLVYETKFNLIPREKSLLLFNKTGDLRNHHPKLYKYEGAKHLLEKPEEANMGFYIRDPDDKDKTYQSLGLIVLAEIT